MGFNMYYYYFYSYDQSGFHDMNESNNNLFTFTLK